ncbi:MAG: hypothetical protein IKG85_05495 [Clostridia bacterium]|nr:hypothetical protein [Clostridia bacterium]
MKLWGKIRKDDHTVSDEVVAVHAKHAYEVGDWTEPMTELCRKLNLSRPVILKKHVRDLEQFSRAVFSPADFMEPVDFDRFEVELF